MKKDRNRIDYLTQEDKDNAPILFQDIKKIFAEKKIERIFTNDLVKYLCELPESRWNSYFDTHDSKVSGRYINKLLNTYGVHSLILRIGKQRLRGYERGHFEQLKPNSHDLLKWLQNEWEPYYVSLGDMWGAGIPTQETLDAIKELESYGWLNLNFSKSNVMREKIWHIRSKNERGQDRRKTKTIKGIRGLADSCPFKHFKLDIADTEPSIRFKKYMEDVRIPPASKKTTAVEKFFLLINFPMKGKLIRLLKTWI